jgi:outer membrane protein assembly factor BamB
MRRTRRGVFPKLAIAWLGLCLTANGSFAAEPPVSPFSTHGRNLYRLASAKLSGSDDQHEVVGATCDQRISAFDADGGHRWDFAVGGFVYDLAAGDLDADGIDEILAACADGQVYAIDSDGSMLWKHDVRAPVWQVAMARQADGSRVVLAGGVSRKVVALSGTGQVLAEPPEWILRGPKLHCWKGARFGCWINAETPWAAPHAA